MGVRSTPNHESSSKLRPYRALRGPPWVLQRTDRPALETQTPTHEIR